MYGDINREPQNVADNKDEFMRQLAEEGLPKAI